MTTEEQKELALKLRNEVSLGIMDCRALLEEHDWNYEKAKANYDDFFRSRHILVNKKLNKNNE